MEEKRNCNCNNNNNENEENVMQVSELQEQNRNQSDCQRREMIMKIKELDFAIIELALYLDTHPNDKKALCLHRNYTKEVKDLKDKYQRVYGPLTINYPCNKWRWLEEPWATFKLGVK